jgi:hypothetical protein
MKRRALVSCAGILLFGLEVGLAPIPARAAAAPVVDQSSTAHDRTWVLSTPYSQTFKVGKAGALTGIDLWVFTHTGSPAVTISIEKAVGTGPGHPSGTVLEKHSVAIGTNDGWVHFALTPMNVTVGEYLAIVFSMTSACSVRGSVSNPYKSGYAQNAAPPWAYLQNSSRSDFAFQTYVGPAVAATPTPKPAASVTATPEASATAEPSASASASASATATPTPQPTATPAPTPGSGSAGSNDSSGAPLPIVAAVVIGVILLSSGLWYVLVRRPKRWGN